MLVVVIVGVLAATVTIGFTNLGQSNRVQAEAERLALAIELARQQALRRNEVWGLAVDDTSYAFRRRGTAGRWSVVERRPFASWSAEPGVRFEARATLPRSTRQRGDRRKSETRLRSSSEAEEQEEEDPPPAFAIYPGGEMTPLRIVVMHPDAPSWVARSDGIERVRATLLDDADAVQTAWRMR